MPLSSARCSPALMRLQEASFLRRTLAVQCAFGARSQPSPKLHTRTTLPTNCHSSGAAVLRSATSSWVCRASAEGVPGVDNGGSGGGGAGVGGRGGGGGGGGDGGESSGGAGAGFGLAALWNRYLELLDSGPLPTKAFTSLILNALGDILCQCLIEGRSSLDLKRLGVSSLLGFVLVGPTLHFWYGALSKIVTAQGTTGALLRLGLDQFVFSPAFIALFFGALLTLEGRPQDLGAKMKQDWKEAVITNWKLWIPFQFLNFRFVPLRLQVAASNVVAVVWTSYLSLASHRTVAQ